MYAWQAYQPALKNCLPMSLNISQNQSLQIIHPELSYNEVLESLRLKSLKDRRVYAKGTWLKMQHPDHRHHSLLPEPRAIDYNLRQVVFTNIKHSGLYELGVV